VSLAQLGKQMTKEEMYSWTVQKGSSSKAVHLWQLTAFVKQYLPINKPNSTVMHRLKTTH
jgi:hypothetical protein